MNTTKTTILYQEDLLSLFKTPEGLIEILNNPNPLAIAKISYNCDGTCLQSFSLVDITKKQLLTYLIDAAIDSKDRIMCFNFLEALLRLDIKGTSWYKNNEEVGTSHSNELLNNKEPYKMNTKDTATETPSTPSAASKLWAAYGPTIKTAAFLCAGAFIGIAAKTAIDNRNSASPLVGSGE
jgi:hypothetical protein